MAKQESPEVKQDIGDLTRKLTYPILSLYRRSILSSLPGTSVNPFLGTQNRHPEIFLQTLNAGTNIKAKAGMQTTIPPSAPNDT